MSNVVGSCNVLVVLIVVAIAVCPCCHFLALPIVLSQLLRPSVNQLVV